MHTMHTAQMMEDVVRRYFDGVNKLDPVQIRSCFGETASIRDVNSGASTNKVVRTMPRASELVERSISPCHLLACPFLPARFTFRLPTSEPPNKSLQTVSTTSGPRRSPRMQPIFIRPGCRRYVAATAAAVDELVD
jgi:hypothetical protein